MAYRPSQAEALQLPHVDECRQCALFVAQPPAPLIMDGRAKLLLVCPNCGGSLRCRNVGKDGKSKNGEDKDAYVDKDDKGKNDISKDGEDKADMGKDGEDKDAYVGKGALMKVKVGSPRQR